jgi:hypothetical protein
LANILILLSLITLDSCTRTPKSIHTEVLGNGRYRLIPLNPNINPQDNITWEIDSRDIGEVGFSTKYQFAYNGFYRIVCYKNQNNGKRKIIGKGDLLVKDSKDNHLICYCGDMPESKSWADFDYKFVDSNTIQVFNKSKNVNKGVYSFYSQQHKDIRDENPQLRYDYKGVYPLRLRVVDLKTGQIDEVTKFIDCRNVVEPESSSTDSGGGGGI